MFHNIAKLIKEKRFQCGYSQSELARLLGLKNGQEVSNVERGICSIPLKHMVDVCRVLKIDQEEMIEARLKDDAHKYRTLFEKELAPCQEAEKQLPEKLLS